MSKPLFRFTVGPCIPQGLEVLKESVKKTTATLGIDAFDWMICHNGLSEDEQAQLSDMTKDLPIVLYEQSWNFVPIPDDQEWATPKRKDGSFEWNGNHCGGTLWKVCPARMRMESHEIVMDNDIVLLEKFPQIDHFLKSTHMALILEEPIKFYGRYDAQFGDKEPYLNSGFIGFPPGYDYGAEILRVWEETGSFQKLSHSDEQGLLMYTLSRLPSVRIKKHQMVELLATDVDASKRLTGKEAGLHFTQANRIPNHLSWKKYKEIMSNE